MPKYRTPHHTDGDGIGKKLTEEALRNRLAELADTATSEHRQVLEKWRGMLDHARAAGEALIEAKRRLGHRTKWTEWRHRNLISNGVMSKETCNIYRRIAREWDNPRIQEARANGITINSINKFLTVLRGQHDKASEQQPETKTDTECVPQAGELERQEIRQAFAAKLKKLSKPELEVLYEMYDELWARLYADLRRTVCAVHDCDYQWAARELARLRKSKAKPATFFDEDQLSGMQKRMSDTHRHGKPRRHRRTVSS